MRDTSKNRFEVILIDSNQAIAQLVERVMAQVFPEACLLQATTLHTVESQLEYAARTPRLILLSSQLIARSTELSELATFLARPAIKPIPVLLLDYEQAPNRIAAYYEAGVSAVHLKPETLAEWQTLLADIRQFWFVYARTVTI